MKIIRILIIVISLGFSQLLLAGYMTQDGFQDDIDYRQLGSDKASSYYSSGGLQSYNKYYDPSSSVPGIVTTDGVSRVLITSLNYRTYKVPPPTLGYVDGYNKVTEEAPLVNNIDDILDDESFIDNAEIASIRQGVPGYGVSDFKSGFNSTFKRLYKRDFDKGREAGVKDLQGKQQLLAKNKLQGQQDKETAEARGYANTAGADVKNQIDVLARPIKITDPTDPTKTIEFQVMSDTEKTTNKAALDDGLTPVTKESGASAGTNAIYKANSGMAANANSSIATISNSIRAKNNAHAASTYASSGFDAAKVEKTVKNAQQIVSYKSQLSASGAYDEKIKSIKYDLISHLMTAAQNKNSEADVSVLNDLQTKLGSDETVTFSQIKMAVPEGTLPEDIKGMIGNINE